MAAPRKAIFAVTQTEARRIMGAFDLSGTDWFGCALDSALAGRQFDHIVVKMPDRLTPALGEKLSHLRTRLSENGRLDFI